LTPLGGIQKTSKTKSMAEATQCKAMLALPSRPTKKKHKKLNKGKDWEEKN